MEQERLETIKTTDIEKGMYVILPLSWHEHPFVKNKFIVKSDVDIEKIKALKVREIQVDPARYENLAGQTPQGTARQNPEKGEAVRKPEKVEAVRKVFPDALKTAICDTQAPPERKAEAIRQESIAMMKTLLDDPTAENIREAKKGISEIVNLILKEEQTLYYLLNLTSYDHYTYAHSVSVGILAVALAKSLFKNAHNHDIHALGAGFFLHDLGKVGIDNNIINKPGKLNDEEMREIRLHPQLGFKLLQDTRQLTDESKIIALQHHERVDGAGYPKGLRGNDIHVYARICSIADVYDALTSDRPYRKKMTPFDALKLMHAEMIHHFQRDLFERFVLLFKPPEGMRA
jgi:HD-GYP domain-containing protein (c-di-GMP phosphodiesterase class II)